MKIIKKPEVYISYFRNIMHTIKQKSFLLILLLLVSVVAVKTQNPQLTITHNSLTRTYLLHLPPAFNSADTLPLVFCLHGLNQTAGRIAQVSGFDTIADRERFIVVYPFGKDTIWNTFSNPYHSGVDDAGFISALIDTLERDYHINLNRVYSTGMSNGGFMSYKLACELSERIAAIAPLAGAFTDSMRYYCHPSRAMPVLHIHGASDFVVGYNGGFVNISVANTLDYWKQYNNCPLTEVVTQLPDIITTDNCTVTKYEWLPCNNQSEVIHYKVNGGGHTWPGSSVTFGGLGGNTNYDIDASEIIWEFFNRFTLQGRNTTGIREVGNVGVEIYPNPAQSEIQFSLANAANHIEHIIITDVSGRNVLTQAATENSFLFTLNTSSLTNGIYFATVYCGKQSFSRRFVVSK